MSAKEFWILLTAIDKTDCLPGEDRSEKIISLLKFYYISEAIENGYV